MALDKAEIVSEVANKAGNISAASYALTWLADAFSALSVNEWVAIAVGASAIFSYGSAGLLNLAKKRQLKNEGSA